MNHILKWTLYQSTKWLNFQIFLFSFSVEASDMLCQKGEVTSNSYETVAKNYFSGILLRWRNMIPIKNSIVFVEQVPASKRMKLKLLKWSPIPTSWRRECFTMISPLSNYNVRLAFRVSKGAENYLII